MRFGGTVYAAALAAMLGLAIAAQSLAQPTGADTEPLSRHYFLLLDRSGSMKGPRLRALKTALIERFLPEVSAGTVLHFSAFDRGIQQEMTIEVRSAEDVKRAEEFVNGLRAEGAVTYAWSSLRGVLAKAKTVKDASPANLVEIVLYTDGKDNEPGGPSLENVLSAYDALRAVRKGAAGLKVFTLGFKLDEEDRARFVRHGARVANVPDSMPIPVPSSVDFTWWPREIEAGALVKFTNRSIPKTSHRESEWNFGDGSVVREVEPEHTFKTAGAYTVVLGIGGDLREQELTVRPPAAPESALAVRTSATDRLAGTDIIFQSQARGVVARQSWNFGDGAASEEKDPVHRYAKAGRYRVSLAVEGPGGKSTAEHTVEIQTGIELSFRTEPRSGRAPLLVNVRNLSTGELDGWLWDFGDGSRAVEKDPLPHRYTTEGDYRITLSARATRMGAAVPAVSLSVRVASAIRWEKVIPLAILGSVLCGVVLRALWRRYGPLAVKPGHIFALDDLADSLRRETLSLGGGRRKPDNTFHDIALPLKAGMLPDFAELRRASLPEDCVVKEESQSDALVWVIGPDVGRARPGTGFPSPKVRTEDGAIGVPRRSILMIGTEAWCPTEKAGGDWGLARCWSLVRSPSAGLARILRGSTEIEIDERPEPLAPNDRLDLAGFRFTVKINHELRWQLLLEAVSTDGEDLAGGPGPATAVQAEDE